MRRREFIPLVGGTSNLPRSCVLSGAHLFRLPAMVWPPIPLDEHRQDRHPQL